MHVVDKAELAVGTEEGVSVEKFDVHITCFTGFMKRIENDVAVVVFVNAFACRPGEHQNGNVRAELTETLIEGIVGIPQMGAVGGVVVIIVYKEAHVQPGDIFSHEELAFGGAGEAEIDKIHVKLTGQDRTVSIMMG